MFHSLTRSLGVLGHYNNEEIAIHNLLANQMHVGKLPNYYILLVLRNKKYVFYYTSHFELKFCYSKYSSVRKAWPKYERHILFLHFNKVPLDS